MTQDPDVTRSRTDRQAAQAWAFDRIGEHYDEAFPHKEGQLSAGEWLLERLAPGSRVLDVGCGTGIPTARQLVDAGHHVVGVDISEEMLRLARRDVPERLVVVGDGDHAERRGDDARRHEADRLLGPRRQPAQEAHHPSSTFVSASTALWPPRP